MKMLLLGLFAVFLFAGCLGGGAQATPTPIATVEPTAVPTVEITPPPAPTEAPSIEPTPVYVASTEVKIIYGAFDPVRIRVAAGTKVTWENQDSALHSVQAVDGSFDSGSIPARQTFSYTFNTPGLYEYSDDLGVSEAAWVLVE